MPDGRPAAYLYLGMVELEDYFLQNLAVRQARSLLRRNLGTMLCFQKEDEQVGDQDKLSRVHVLNISG